MESLAPAPAVSGARRAVGGVGGVGGRAPLLPARPAGLGPEARRHRSRRLAAEERAFPAPSHGAGAGGAVPGLGGGRAGPAASRRGAWGGTGR